MRSLDVAPPRIAECPVQLEGVEQEWHPFGRRVSASAFEIQVVRRHVEESLLTGDELGTPIEPAKWRPLIMSFCKFYGLGEQVWQSTLAEIPEAAYRPVAHMTR